MKAGTQHFIFNILCVVDINILSLINREPGLISWLEKVKKKVNMYYIGIHISNDCLT